MIIKSKQWAKHWAAFSLHMSPSQPAEGCGGCRSCGGWWPAEFFLSCRPKDRKNELKHPDQDLAKRKSFLIQSGLQKDAQCISLHIFITAFNFLLWKFTEGGENTVMNPHILRTLVSTFC